MAEPPSSFDELLEAYLATPDWDAAAAWLQTTPAADSTFVAALITMADRARLVGHQFALQLGQHALLAADQRGDLSQRGTARHRLAVQLQLRGQPTAAAELYAEALPLYVQVGDDLGRANVLKSQGDLARQLGDPAGAGRLYAEALPLYVQVGDDLGRANVLKSLRTQSP